jgi:hypothetical protein
MAGLYTRIRLCSLLGQRPKKRRGTIQFATLLTQPTLRLCGGLFYCVGILSSWPMGRLRDDRGSAYQQAVRLRLPTLLPWGSKDTQLTQVFAPCLRAWIIPRSWNEAAERRGHTPIAAVVGRPPPAVTLLEIVCRWSYRAACRLQPR